ncbi:MAG: EamA family transporter [Alphaproteobacteria bacterium]
MNNQQVGLLSSIVAFLMWGLVLPSATRVLSYVESPLSVMSIRVFFAFFVVLLVQIFRNKLSVIKRLFNLRILALQFISAALIGINWFTFIYAVKVDQLNQAALGYYIMPLLGITLGMVFFKERLSLLQVIAIALAVMGILWSIFVAGSLPLISMSVALSFALYGFVKRAIPLDAFSGLFLEILLMIVFVPLLYYIFNVSDMFKILPDSSAIYWAAASVGLFTVLPLFFSGIAYKTIDYSVYSVLFWSVPSMQFITSVFFWHEHFDANKLITFIFIWMALCLYGYSIFKGKKAKAT